MIETLNSRQNVIFPKNINASGDFAAKTNIDGLSRVAEEAIKANDEYARGKPEKASIITCAIAFLLGTTLGTQSKNKELEAKNKELEAELKKKSDPRNLREKIRDQLGDYPAGVRIATWGSLGAVLGAGAGFVLEYSKIAFEVSAWRNALDSDPNATTKLTYPAPIYSDNAPLGKVPVDREAFTNVSLNEALKTVLKEDLNATRTIFGVGPLRDESGNIIMKNVTRDLGSEFKVANNDRVYSKLHVDWKDEYILTERVIKDGPFGIKKETYPLTDSVIENGQSKTVTVGWGVKYTAMVDNWLRSAPPSQISREFAQREGYRPPLVAGTYKEPEKITVEYVDKKYGLRTDGRRYIDDPKKVAEAFNVYKTVMFGALVGAVVGITGGIICSLIAKD